MTWPIAFFVLGVAGLVAGLFWLSWPAGHRRQLRSRHPHSFRRAFWVEGD